MPSATTVRSLLASRLERSLAAWRERIDFEIRDHDRECAALVHIAPAVDPAMPLTDWLSSEPALEIRIMRHMGGDDFLVYLKRPGDQNQLALHGHLDVTRDGYRMIAI